jgi:hypothetical protein
MTNKVITRIAKCVAAFSIAALPLAAADQAHAINKHELGGDGGIVVPASDNGREVNPAQIAAGALGGATVTAAAFVASPRIRRHRDSAPRPI